MNAAFSAQWYNRGVAELFIPVILGTAREGRRSEYAARFMLEEVRRSGFETELVDVRDFELCKTDNTETDPKSKAFAEKMRRADGCIIVSPEYNHGYPGDLKMVLDEAFKEYARKPVGICGVSKGGLGGARMVEQLKLVCIELRMVPIPASVYFSNINQLFDEKGAIRDPSYQERVKKFLDEMKWYAAALKKARESS